MSRLYMKAFSDTISDSSPKTMTGSESMTVYICYGSKDKSKPLCSLQIDFDRKFSRPRVSFATPPEEVS